MLWSTRQQLAGTGVWTWQSSKWNQISLKQNQKNTKFGPLSLRSQMLNVAPWGGLVAHFRAPGQVQRAPVPHFPLRAIPQVCRKLKISGSMYPHCRHCVVSARNKQWKHWNTMRNGKFWQLETLDFRPCCHSVSQTILQGPNLKLLTLRAPFLLLTLSSQQLLYQGEQTQHVLESPAATSASPSADVGGCTGPTGWVQLVSTHSAPTAVLGLCWDGPGMPWRAKAPTTAVK